MQARRYFFVADRRGRDPFLTDKKQVPSYVQFPGISQGGNFTQKKNGASARYCLFNKNPDEVMRRIKKTIIM